MAKITPQNTNAPATNYELVRAERFTQSYQTVLEAHDNDLEKVADLWNKASLGRPAKATTIKRWAAPSGTKNPRFEPFIVGMATAIIAYREAELSRALNNVARTKGLDTQ